MDLNDPQERLEGFFPEYEHAPPSSFQQVLQVLEQKTLGQSPTNQYAKGTVFEQLVKAFIEVDKAQRQRFDKVWLWKDYPQRAGRIDTGIDLVARERDGGGLIAIQCKFYARGATIRRVEVDRFIATSSTTEFSGGIFVSTTSKLGCSGDNALGP